MNASRVKTIHPWRMAHFEDRASLGENRGRERETGQEAAIVGICSNFARLWAA
ncbi:hypothetical protein [Starkeya nomas]|uniref:hypothetical protein n=1 Tax=Starkeya nomas TaxID=2666134 RepID=UPI00135A6886|nr:hypothetical protein [Starkeya nomas]